MFEEGPREWISPRRCSVPRVRLEIASARRTFTRSLGARAALQRALYLRPLARGRRGPPRACLRAALAALIELRQHRHWERPYRLERCTDRYLRARHCRVFL